MKENSISKTESVLILKKLVFDIVSFERKGLKNNSEFSMGLNLQISENAANNLYKVSLRLNGTKIDEYEIVVQLTGYFSVDTEDLQMKDVLLRKNAVAILMPYIRSEVSLLTAQPDTDCIVLPPFNINNIFEEECS